MINPFKSGPPKALPPPAPFPAAAAWSAVVGLAALFLTDGGLFIPVLALLIILPGFWTRPRLDDEPVWLARLGLMGIVLAIGLNEPPPDVDGLIDPRVMSLTAQCCAAEMAVILWRRRQTTHGLLGLPAFIFLAACNTFDEHWVRWLAPPYLMLASLALRGWRSRTVAAPVLWAGRRRWLAALLVAFVVALLLGGTLYGGVYRYKNQLSALGMRLLSATPRGMGEATGMSSQPEMSATFNVRGSLVRVLRVEGPIGDPHLRGQAFDEYRRGRWYPLSGERKLIPVGNALHASASGEHTRVIHLLDDGGILFAPLEVSGLRGSDPLSWDAQHGGPLQTTMLAPFVSEYVLGSDAPIWPAPDPAERARCLLVPPEFSARARQLSQSILSRAPTPEGKIRAVETYLMAHHGYSLSFQPGPGDPVSRFLEGDKPAHCQFFAASATLMLRGAGVPTRYVTGYYAHEGAGRSVTVVRQQDAHAWCEAFVDGEGWTTVDATPGAGRPDQTAAPAPESRRWSEWGSDMMSAFRRWVEGLSTRTRLLLITAMAVSLIIPQIVRARRRRAQSGPTEFAYTASPAEMRDMAERFDHWLARMEFPCPPGRPWQEHLDRWGLSDEAPDTLGMVREFVALYNVLRFGPVVGVEDMTRARALLAELETHSGPARRTASAGVQ